MIVNTTTVIIRIIVPLNTIKLCMLHRAGPLVPRPTSTLVDRVKKFKTGKRLIVNADQDLHQTIILIEVTRKDLLGCVICHFLLKLPFGTLVGTLILCNMPFHMLQNGCISEEIHTINVFMTN